MERSESGDLWAAGSLYEPYVGRWSRLVARELLRRLLLPAGKEWLDVGSGTGALSQIILEDAFPNSVTCIDPSAGFVEYAKAHIVSARVSFKIGDARALPSNSASFDAVVSGLVLNFVPEPKPPLLKWSASSDQAAWWRPMSGIMPEKWSLSDISGMRQLLLILL